MIVEKILEGRRYIEVATGYLCDEAELAYLAGIVDGEGSIFIAKNSARLQGSYTLRLSVTSTDRVLIDWIHARFGGNTCSQRKPNRWSPAYHWRLSGPHAKQLLEAIGPYLVIKRVKADWAIAFQQSRLGIGVHPLAPGKIAEYRWFKKELSNARCN